MDEFDAIDSSKASAVDIIITLILPMIGAIIGVVALMKGEGKRGGTMIAIGVVMMVIWVALGGI